MRGLKDMGVLVTGAAGGIGRAVVERLMNEGGRVVATDLQAPSDLADVADRVAGDVTSEADVKRVVERAHETLGRLDAIVLCAGISWVGPTHEMNLGEFDRVLSVSVRGTFLFCKAALPGMLEQGAGRIVTFGSTAAVSGAPMLAAYAAAKGAVLQFTRSIATEYAARGIRANCLCPGATNTPLMQKLMRERSDPEPFANAYPIGRFAEPEEVAAATTYLLSDDASFMIGAAMMFDGGFTA